MNISIATGNINIQHKCVFDETTSTNETAQKRACEMEKINCFVKR